MKLITNGDMIVLYLNRMYISSLDFTDKEATEKYMKRLLIKISNKYDINIDGYYVVNLYVDMNYGVVIEIVKEELEYLDYFANQIEINTKVTKGSFLYEVYNFDNSLLKKFIVYKIKDKLYLRVKDTISDLEMGKLIENSNIIYGNKANDIIRKAKIVR